MRTRIAIRLALGILFGVILVLLPGVFSTTTSQPSTSPTVSTTQGQSPSRFIPVPGLQGPSSDVSGVSFFAIVAFIFLPSVVFSLIVRRWVEKKARDYSGDSSIDR